nr:DivIVA domain-containing protein [uncultured Oscillibacter sp.]
MLTPQEVSTHAFTKAVMGGYNMAMVDEFLDELTDDYTALYKENAALKAKLKVLVEKVEEYRATEDSMRATLLTAQRMADSIVREAEGKRDEILAQAESGAQEKIARYQQELATEEDRLKQGQQELARFIAASRELCAKELQFLEQLPKLPVEQEAPAPAEEAPVEEIEEKVMAAFATQPAAGEQPPAPEEAPAPVEDYPEGDPFAREDPLEATRRINLDDLKFGRNYGGES